MKKTIVAVAIAMTAVGATTAFAFPVGNYTNKSGDVTITKASGNSYDIMAIASHEDHSCEVSGTLPETAPNVLSGKINDEPVTVKISKGKLILKAKDGHVCASGVTISGAYRKK